MPTKYIARGNNGGNKSKSRLSPKVQDQVRALIDSSSIVRTLNSHIKGDLKMEASQLRAAEILLRKCLPDLASISISGDPDNPFLVQDISDKPLEHSSTKWLESNKEVIEGETVN